eukprot:Skav214077  [mRNA]  locus=scaffold2927:42483:43688:- [translate_table: standard]
MYPCKNLRCTKRSEFEGVTDNARLPCDIKVLKNDDDPGHDIPEQIFRGAEKQFGAQTLAWSQRTPRQLFRYNEQILLNKMTSEDPLTIRLICKRCRKKVAECDALDTVERLYLDLREYIAHDRQTPLLYIPDGPNLDLPDDANKVCQLSHGPGVNKFVAEVLKEKIQVIASSLESGELGKTLKEKGKAAKEKFDSEYMTYIRIGLGLKELGRLTAVLELWPKGYRSPKHHHGGCAGSVRVLHGEIHCRLYETLRDKEPMKFKDGDCGLKLPLGVLGRQIEHDTLILKAGDTTWLNRQNWWVHEVWCGAGDFALSLHLYKSCTDEFAFVKPADEKTTAEIAKGAPKNDFFWNLADGLGLSKEDKRITEIDGPEGPRDFVRVVLNNKAWSAVNAVKTSILNCQ